MFYNVSSMIFWFGFVVDFPPQLSNTNQPKSFKINVCFQLRTTKQTIDLFISFACFFDKSAFRIRIHACSDLSTKLDPVWAPTIHQKVGFKRYQIIIVGRILYRCVCHLGSILRAISSHSEQGSSSDGVFVLARIPRVWRR